MVLNKTIINIKKTNRCFFNLIHKRVFIRFPSSDSLRIASGIIVRYDKTGERYKEQSGLKEKSFLVKITDMELLKGNKMYIHYDINGEIYPNKQNNPNIRCRFVIEKDIYEIR